jgi:type II secretory pathway predicted ATPase ExeA
MLCKHFGFKTVPFIPQQSNFFESESSKPSLLKLQTLKYVPQISLITGNIGSGKTCLVNSFVNSLDPMEFRVVSSRLRKPSVRGLFKNIASYAGIQHSIYGDDIKLQLLSYFDEIRNQGKFTIVVLDEVHTFSFDVLDQLKTFFDSNNNFSLILIAQPEISKKLRLHACLPLKQRISIFINLKALSLIETQNYVDFKLKSAGLSKPLFDESCFPKLFQYSEGIYRMIDQICFQAITEAFLTKTSIISDKIIEKAFNSLDYNF